MKQRKDALVFVGSLNRPVPHFTAANGRGITTLALDESTGKLRRLAELGGMDNPTYLAVLPSRGMLYATSEVFGAADGSVRAYAYEHATGSLVPQGDRQSTRGSLSAHCSTDRDGRYVFVANYAHETRDEKPGRHVVAYAIQPDGALSATISEHAHSGAGPHADRQGVPHAHCVAAAPDNRFALVTDLGTDSVASYRIDPAGSGLLPPATEPLRLAPGSGPRHLVFHPLLDCVYVVNELDNTLYRLGYTRTDGTLCLQQTIDALPAASTPSYAADIAVSNDGRFLYASFRGADCIVVFALASDGAIAKRAALYPSGGRTPRSFALSPSNRFLLAANQDSDNLVVWRLDETSGCVVDKVDELSMGTPMCVKVIA
ncbi:MAG TPA: lactonase family protein [Paraburkholderia sp.]|nr:lactonase family protein [Paraburkholderia sp.]